MKNFILLALILFAIPAFADNTNYATVSECDQAMKKYYQEAFEKKQSVLADWFASFLLGAETALDIDGNTVTHYRGCNFLESSNSRDQILWQKIQLKLDKQIDQLKNGQPSLFGDRASITCKLDQHTHQIMYYSCG